MPTASRRHGRSTTTPSSRSTSAPNASITSAGKPASIRPSRRAGRSRTSPSRMPRKWRRSSRSCGGQGLHPSPLPLGLLRVGEDDGCILCSTCNSFACKLHAKSEADVCCVRPAIQRPNVDAVDQCLRPPSDHGRLGPEGGRRRSRAQRRDAPGRRVAVRRVVRGRQLGRAAAAVGERRASRRPGEFVGAGGTAIHGAPGDDDAGLPSVSAGTRWSFRRRSRSTISIFAVPIRRIRSDRFSRRAGPTGSWPRRSYPWIPLWAYEQWVSRGVDWLVMSEDLPRLENRVTVDPDGRHPAALSAEQPEGSPEAGQGDQADPPPARFLGRGHAFARQQEHDASVRHAVFRNRPARDRCWIRSAAPTTSRICSSSTRRSSRRRRPSIPA